MYEAVRYSDSAIVQGSLAQLCLAERIQDQTMCAAKPDAALAANLKELGYGD